MHGGSAPRVRAGPCTGGSSRCNARRAGCGSARRFGPIVEELTGERTRALTPVTPGELLATMGHAAPTGGRNRGGGAVVARRATAPATRRRGGAGALAPVRSGRRCEGARVVGVGVQYAVDCRAGHAEGLGYGGHGGLAAGVHLSQPSHLPLGQLGLAAPGACGFQAVESALGGQRQRTRRPWQVCRNNLPNGSFQS